MHSYFSTGHVDPFPLLYCLTCCLVHITRTQVHTMNLGRIWIEKKLPILL
jgi:hypothetical protein